MKKQEYIKPVMCVVVLQHQHRLLTGSVTSLSTNLKDDEVIELDTTPSGESVWGR